MSNAKTQTAPQKIVKEILVTLPKRNRDIIERRFGFKSGDRETLESIGEKYGITRERVRQIQNNTMDNIMKTPAAAKLDPFFELFHGHVSDHGYLRREDSLLDEDLKEIFHSSLHDEDLKPTVYFILGLKDDKFSYHSESEDFHPLWSTNKEFIGKARSFLNNLSKAIQDANELLTMTQLKDLARPIAEQSGFLSSDKAIHSAIDAFKHIDSNVYGDYGMTDWANVSPRGVRDKAYLVLKKGSAPLHFSSIAQAINDTFGKEKDAKVQTVHNELIKDGRFVLVGRGLYGLSEWGYVPGTVKEVLRKILQESQGALSREELLDAVRKQRFIKDNTILLSLQDKKQFVRTEDGRYQLK
jgi:hypothetical protein